MSYLFPRTYHYAAEVRLPSGAVFAVDGLVHTRDKPSSTDFLPALRERAAKAVSPETPATCVVFKSVTRLS